MSIFKYDSESGYVSYSCPACGHLHSVPVRPVAAERWNWNGNLEAPTLTPSVFNRSIKPLTEEEGLAYDAAYESLGAAILNDSRFRWWCHHFVTDGKIVYCNDCTHSYSGQTVPLPEMNT